jgi:hypothetical protein
MTDTDDEWAPSEVEVQRDQQGAVKIVVAFILGITSAAGPVGAAVAGMTGPFFPNIVDKLRWRRVRNATETAIDAAKAAKGLRDHGYSWAEIGYRLGLTRQAAQQRWGTSKR